MAHQTLWQRKASQSEEAMQKMNEGGMLLSMFWVSLSTRKPLQRNQLEQALSLLYRKCLTLRTCVDWREDGLWLKEMEKEKIDFEVTSAPVDELCDYMHTQTYSPDGPMWRARLLPVPSPRYLPHNLSSFHEDLKDTFPHCYHLVFGFCHTLGDGHTFVRILAAFFNILDSVLAGKEVNTDEIGSFDLNEQHLREKEECIEKFSTDEMLREKFSRMAFNGKKESPLIRHLLIPSCEAQERMTKIYAQTLDQSVTTTLLEKCRARRVTLSSLIAAVGNLTLAEMLLEKGVIRDTYSISDIHLVNMRRIWPEEMREKAFGCYIATLPQQFFATPITVNEPQFWEYVECVHHSLYTILNDDLLTWVCFSIWNIYNDQQTYWDHDLTFNTRGNLTQMFSGTTEITVTNIIPSSSIHIGKNKTIDQRIGTVRGRLTHSISYNTGVISEVTAVRYSNKVYALLLKAAGNWEN